MANGDSNGNGHGLFSRGTLVMLGSVVAITGGTTWVRSIDLDHAINEIRNERDTMAKDLRSEREHVLQDLRQQIERQNDRLRADSERNDQLAREERVRILEQLQHRPDFDDLTRIVSDLDRRINSQDDRLRSLERGAGQYERGR
jgi:hypothetical protein